MTEAQYRQMLANRARRSVALFAGGAADGLLRRASREAKRRSTAEEAWNSVVAVEIAEQSAVASYRDGALLIEAASAVVRERIRRQAGTMLRQLKARVPGLVSLRIAAPGEDDGPREEVD
jgi:hypothetical protein